MGNEEGRSMWVMCYNWIKQYDRAVGTVAKIKYGWSIRVSRQLYHTLYVPFDKSS